MIYVTGDTHGSHDFAKLIAFANEHPELTKQDYLIIAGDFGGVWSENTLEDDLRPFQKLPLTVLFVDGNHENFNLINAYPIDKWNGGKVHFIKPDIIHLMRGQVYEIDGKTFFTFGGASSTDRHLRKQAIDWWPQEVPTLDDLDEAIENLRRYHKEVDYIISHSCDEKALWLSPLRMRTTKLKIFPENMILSELEKIVKYKHWYFGHYHMDGDLTDTKTVLYQEVRKVE